jgi:hypothetical protein
LDALPDDGCAQILLPGKGKRPSIVLITPSIWEMSASTSRTAAPDDYLNET